MSVVNLPTGTVATRIFPRLVGRSSDLPGQLGGSDQTLFFIGDKWSIRYEMPPLDYEEAMEWMAAITRGRRQGVRIPVPQPGVVVGTPGAPKVNGADQAGTELIVDGFAIDYPMGPGRWFNVVTDDRRLLYLLAEDAQPIAGASITELSFEPMLRRPPSDNDDLIVDAPVIEGRLEGNVAEWSVESFHEVGFNFTVVEL